MLFQDRLSVITSVISLIFRFNCLYVSSDVGSLLLEDDVTGGFLGAVLGCLLLCGTIECCSNELVMARRKEKAERKKSDKKKVCESYMYKREPLCVGCACVSVCVRVCACTEQVV